MGGRPSSDGEVRSIVVVMRNTMLTLNHRAGSPLRRALRDIHLGL